MATHSSILAWKIPWTEETGGLRSIGHKESDTTEQRSRHIGLKEFKQRDLGSIPWRSKEDPLETKGRSPGEGNGYPLQYSGPENSMDCIVHGVAKSRTPLSDFHFHAFYDESRLGFKVRLNQTLT